MHGVVRIQNTFLKDCILIICHVVSTGVGRFQCGRSGEGVFRIAIEYYAFGVFRVRLLFLSRIIATIVFIHTWSRPNRNRIPRVLLPDLQGPEATLDFPIDTASVEKVVGLRPELPLVGVTELPASPEGYSDSLPSPTFAVGVDLCSLG